jgi:hypothetical protein
MGQHLLPEHSSLQWVSLPAVTEHRRRIVRLNAWLEDLRGDEQAWGLFDAGGLDGSTAYTRMEECLRIAEEQLGRLGGCVRPPIKTDTKGAA